MKKFVSTAISLFLVFNLFAQVSDLTENIVEPPMFVSDSEYILTNDESRELWNNYLIENLNDNENYDPGILILLFTVTAQGEVDDITVQNPITTNTDNAVSYFVANTNGMWLPGKVNGEAVDMQKTVQIRFSDPNEPSLESMAIEHIRVAVKKFNKTNSIINSEKFNNKYSYKRQDRIIKRKTNTSIYHLNNASRYQPNEISVAFWLGKVYELKGDIIKSEEKFLEYNRLVDPEYQAAIENGIIDIAIK